MARQRCAALALAAGLLAAGCGRPKPEADPGAAPTPADNGRVRIGAFMSLTGDTAQYGISAYNGMTMAVEEANSSGGVGGRRVELVVQDTRSDAVETEVVVRRLVGEFRVHALLGEVVSSRTLAAARVAQAARVPMLTPSATTPEVTQVGDYVFRSCYTDPHQGAALAHFAARDLGARRAAFLIDAGQHYSSALARFIREEFTRHGGEVVMTAYYGAGAADYTSQLREVGAARPEVIFIPGYYLEAGLMARQLKGLGVEAPLVGGDGWDSPRLFEIGGTALVGAYFSSHYSADDTDPVVRNFVEGYRRLFNSVPDAFAATAYDAARVMLAALARAPTLDAAAVRDALAATRDFPGVTGPVSFDSGGDASKPVVIIRIEEHGRHAVWRRVEHSELADWLAPSPTPTPTPPKRRRRGR